MSRLRTALALVSLSLALCSLGEAGRFYEFTEGDWSGVDGALNAAVEAQAFPGCVALVGDHTGVLYAKAFGNYTFGAAPPYVPAGYEGSASPPMSIDTRFDMASCTKVTSTLTAVAMLYDDGFLPLEMRIADESLLGPSFGQNGKQDITVLNCLLHNAGFPPDPNPNYWDPAFGCPQTTEPHPAMDFSCRLRIYESLFTQPLDRAPGIKYVYSDISFITLSVVVGKVVRDNAAFYGLSEASVLPNCLMGDDSDVLCYFEAFVRLNVFERLGMKSTGFLPTEDTWGSCAPAENDTSYQRIQLQGQVSDGNAYALGGIAGHAGLFSTVTDLAVLVRSLLFGEPEWIVSQETMALFRTEYNHSQSSRAIGWNTNDPTVYDEGWNLSCGNMSPQTFMHTGYTGTEICADPVNKVFTILLTNRVYPDDSAASKTAIHTARQNYNNAVLAALGLARDRFNAKLRDAYAEYAEHAAAPRPAPSAPSTVVTPFAYPLFKQCNSSWGNHVIENQTICEVGCLMSSISMALNGKEIPLPMPASHEDGHPVELARGDTVHRRHDPHSVDASFHALHSAIDYVAADPSTLNEWLRDNHGYVDGDDLDETALPPIDPSRVVWVGARKPDEVTPQLIRDYLDQNVIVIANVMKGRHFVLVTGYDTDPSKSDLWYVNDPGFDREYYTADEVVGWRLFLFYPCALGEHALPGPAVPVAMQ